jgi:hypothetical protein
MWAVTPLSGVNDSVEDAEALAEMALEFTERTNGIRPRISLVPYNSISAQDPYQRVPVDKEGTPRARIMRPYCSPLLWLQTGPKRRQPRSKRVLANSRNQLPLASTAVVTISFHPTGCGIGWGMGAPAATSPTLCTL